MPGVTPNFNIPYPCSGENIDCTIFADFTDAIQDAIDTVDALTVQALNRPAARIDGSGQAITVAVTTNATFATETYDNDNMANLGVNNDRLTIVTTGMYMITGASQLTSAFTTITSNSVAISNNGTILYRRKNSSDPATNIAMSVSVTGLLSLTAGDILRLPILWTGTGGPTNTFTSTLSARLVSLP